MGGGAFGSRTGLIERHALGMRPPAGLSPASPDDPSLANDDATDIRIGPGPSAATLGERKGCADPAWVVYSPHLVSLSSYFLNAARMSAWRFS